VTPLQPARRRLLLLLQLLAAIIIGWFVFGALSGQWSEVRQQLLSARIRWPWLIGSGVLFLAAHGLLVQTWRYVLGSWGERLPFIEAARIWTVSSLARYVPLKLWQIGAMAFMAQRVGVSPVAATGSAVIGTLVNLAAGAVIVLLTAAALLDVVVPGAAAAPWILLLGAAAAAVSTPFLVRLGMRVLSRMDRRAGAPHDLPGSALLVASIGNVAAWLMYGAAFRMLTVAVLGEAPGTTLSYVAVYTVSYLAGYLVLLAPAGVGVRESAMVLAMPAAGLASAPAAALLAVVSRLWLTLLEVLPGTLFLLRDAIGKRSATPPPNAR
jgi:glycosyltransferase 2 family protein